MMCVCVCFAGAGPSDTPQPGSVEHGHEAVWGFREAGLLAAAALLPARHLWKPAAALLQTRGTQRCYGLLNPGGPRLDWLGFTAKVDNCSDSPSNVFCWYYITITVVLLSTVWSKNNRNIHLNIEKRGHQNLYSVLQQTETPFTRALTYLAVILSLSKWKLFSQIVLINIDIHPQLPVTTMFTPGLLFWWY